MILAVYDDGNCDDNIVNVTDVDFRALWGLRESSFLLEMKFSRTYLFDIPAWYHFSVVERLSFSRLSFIYPSLLNASGLLGAWLLMFLKLFLLDVQMVHKPRHETTKVNSNQFAYICMNRLFWAFSPFHQELVRLETIYGIEIYINELWIESRNMKCRIRRSW